MTTTTMGAVAAAPLVNRIAPPAEVILIGGVSLLFAAAIAIVGTRKRRAPGEALGTLATFPVPERR